ERDRPGRHARCHQSLSRPPRTPPSATALDHRAGLPASRRPKRTATRRRHPRFRPPPRAQVARVPRPRLNSSFPTALPPLPDSKPRPRPSLAKARIVVLLPRGEAIRNFVYSGTLDELERDSQLSVLSVMPNDAFAEMLSARYHSVHPLVERPERWTPRFLRQF